MQQWIETVRTERQHKRAVDFDPVQASIRSNHMELNLQMPDIHNGAPPPVNVAIGSHRHEVPSLQSMCRYRLSINTVPLSGEGDAIVEPASVPGVLRHLPGGGDQMATCTPPRLGINVPCIITRPLGWHRMSAGWQHHYIENYGNNLALVRLGLLSEDDVDLQYLDPHDPRSGPAHKRQRRLLHGSDPIYTERDLDRFVGEIVTEMED